MKLSDKECKQIIAEYAEGGTSFRRLAAKYGVSANTIKKIVDGDADFAQKCTELKNENTKSMIDYLLSRKQIAQDMLDQIWTRAQSEIKTASLRDAMGAAKIICETFQCTGTDGQDKNSGVILNVHFADLSKEK